MLCKTIQASTSIVELDSIKPGPVRHPVLSASIVVRVRLIHFSLAAVLDWPLSQWLDQFSRDRDIESEIVWWEIVAGSYLRYIRKYSIPIERREEVFFSWMMLGNSVSSPRAAQPGLPHLTYDDFEEFMTMFRFAFPEGVLPIDVSKT